MNKASSRSLFVCCVMLLAIDAASSAHAVADSSGNRVVRFKVPVNKGEPESLVLGQPDFNSAVAEPERME